MSHHDIDPSKPVFGRTLISVMEYFRKTTEQVLNSFQTDLIAWQRKVNQLWNTNNAIVRALYNQGLITEENLKQAGIELAAEHQKNMETVRKSAEREVRVSLDDIVKSPVELAGLHSTSGIQSKESPVTSSVPQEGTTVEG